jgi:bla regulator protein BlaR1
MKPLLGEIGSGTVAGIANHLWQSTLVALAAALTAWLLLRRNEAGVRHGLWFAASIKFLLPFSLLISAGRSISSLLEVGHREAWWQNAVIRVSEPFSLSSDPHASKPFALMATLLLAVWATGLVVVLTVWVLRWRSIARIARAGIVVSDAREVRVLRQVERQMGIRRPITLLLCSASLEPGIFGIWRPVLLWPQGISAHLTRSHLQAVIAHEVCHVRRRDNLAAAIHMVVEAVFWFHPLVWWLGTRLMRERERACDQKVLELGSERAVYAESILKTCQYCVGSPLPVLSGVTGAELKQRVVDIMTGEAARRLGFSAKLALSSCAVLALVAPTLFGVWRVYVCDGEAYAPVSRPAMCDAIDGRKKPFAGDMRTCRVLADELLSVPQLPDAMRQIQENGGT